MMSELLLLGVLQVTSYQPIAAQTKPECVNRHKCETSIGDGITMYGCAVSQDLLKSGRVHYGDALYVPGYGWRIVNDTMNARIKNAVDLLVFTREEEKKVGVRHLPIYRAGEPK
jgi:3D (Asp-Asp-Asp) domain-containing protein